MSVCDISCISLIILTYLEHAIIYIYMMLTLSCLFSFELKLRRMLTNYVIALYERNINNMYLYSIFK